MVVKKHLEADFTANMQSIFLLFKTWDAKFHQIIDLITDEDVNTFNNHNLKISSFLICFYLNCTF